MKIFTFLKIPILKDIYNKFKIRKKKYIFNINLNIK